MIESFRNLFNGISNVWLGTNNDYLQQIATPLMSGVAKNTFQLSDAEKIGIVVKSCKTLADNIARLPINLYQETNKGNAILKDDPRQSLLNFSPDGIMTANSFIGALIYNMAIKGNSWARIHRNRRTNIIEKFELIPSNQVEGYKFVNGQLYWIYYKKLENKNTKKIVVNNNNMIHFKMVAKNGYYGLNPMESQRLNMSSLWKSQTTKDNFYTNSAWTPAFLKSTVPDANFIKPFEEAMKQFKDKNVGIENAGKIGMLPPFTDIVTMDMNMVDQEFLSSQAVDARSISGWWGIPPELAGLESGTFKNIEQLTLNFKTFTLGPIITMAEAELEFKLLTEEERKAGKTIEFQLQKLLATDIKSKTSYYKDLFNLGVINGNMIAAAEGFPLYEGGETHFIPTNNLAPVQGVPTDIKNSKTENDSNFRADKVPEEEQDWIYMIHHMHKPDNPNKMEELHHCILWTEKNEKGDSFDIKHVEEKKLLLHVLDIKDVTKSPDFVFDHLNNKYPIEVREVDKVEYAVINKPKAKIKHDD